MNRHPIIKPLAALSVALFGLGSGCASTPVALPLDSFAVNGGHEDHANLYRSAVLVSTPMGNCSGVLIAPRTVLSSAHCFCLPIDFKDRPGTQIYTNSSCEKKALVTDYRYQQEGGKWVDVPVPYRGVITAHENFRSEVQDGKIRSHLADLAVIQLDKEMTEVIPEGVAENEVKLNEPLILVGLGPSKAGGTDDGVRRFGKNLVTDVITTPLAKEFRFSTGGVHILAGNSGGPCFRETEAGRWLVGLSGGFIAEGQDSWFTSTFYYRAWIERQKRRPGDN
jgi:hypothetical protein